MAFVLRGDKRGTALWSCGNCRVSRSQFALAFRGLLAGFAGCSATVIASCRTDQAEAALAVFLFPGPEDKSKRWVEVRG